MQSASFTVGKRRAKITEIFVDHTGRRRRVFTALAAGTGVLLTTAMIILVAGFTGAGPSPLPGLPALNPAQQEIARIPAQAPPSSPAPRRAEPTAATATTTAPARGGPPSATQEQRGNRPSRTAHPQTTKTK